MYCCQENKWPLCILFFKDSLSTNFFDRIEETVQ